MDFQVSEKMQAVIAMMTEFVEKELIPLEPEFLRRDFRELLPELEEKRRLVKQMELWAPNHPQECGGMGLNLMEHGLVSEVLGRTPLGHYVFGCQAPDAGNVEILHKYGTEAQKEKYLLPLVAGKIRSCFSMTEVDLPGSNPVMMDTTAVKDSGDYVINGQKWYSTAADGAAFAIVMAVTNPDEAPHLRASMIIVPTDTPGFNLVRNISVMGHTGSDYFSHAEILYQSCRVPQANLLGPEGWGFVIAQERLGPGRIHHCMRWIGICRRALELMCRRAAQRIITMDGKTLATRQIIQAWIAESAAEIQAARLMTLHAAWKIETLGAKAARDDISLIKFFVADVLQKVVDRALQVHGGLGMTDDTILAFFYRHERAARIYDGADEVHKMSVAKRILKRNS
ncbi:MAG TPA: acyl-CoA dehydrogenase family protein [Syntrophales bacterium]|jgi:alkylation response protein AidB-like acyl-CoA dehydrogenase|nr:acyl-CoA dehydrogenase family protein [Syntrophales bacterium]HPC33628.1 acyl-CoA dehydrogenase family protein [Syntrophales bacterium]HQG35278.1 acyl-CoA dehydrogenase family protein [Syntrophales bacterium]HQI36699.1 acyl-CoA dehydrogenase family protein [Syntrophales bacterium]HRR47293.1 acyl-CoA dehydrogenase family protein [Syntrophales bacterium]